MSKSSLTIAIPEEKVIFVSTFGNYLGVASVFVSDQKYTFFNKLTLSFLRRYRLYWVWFSSFCIWCFLLCHHITCVPIDIASDDHGETQNHKTK